MMLKLKELEKNLFNGSELMIKKQTKKPLRLDVKHLHHEPKPKKTLGNQELKQMPKKMLKFSKLIY